MPTLDKVGIALAAIVAGLAILSAAIKGLSVLLKLYRGLTNLVDDWFGEPARPRQGVSARPGVMARLSAQDARLARIEAQLHRNGGSSLADGVHRIEQSLGTDGR